MTLLRHLSAPLDRPARVRLGLVVFALWALPALRPAVAEPGPVDRAAAAEARIVAGDGRGALEVLGAEGGGARIDRLRLEARLLTEAVVSEADLAARLGPEAGETPRWARTTAALTDLARASATRRFYRATGLVALALALVLLAFTGSREMFRPSRSWLGLLLAEGALVVGAIALAPLAGRLLALVAVALLLLALGAEAAVRRGALPLRLRVFAVAVALSGAAGAVLAVLASGPWSFWMRAISS